MCSDPFCACCASPSSYLHGHAPVHRRHHRKRPPPPRVPLVGLEQQRGAHGHGQLVLEDERRGPAAGLGVGVRQRRDAAPDGQDARVLCVAAWCVACPPKKERNQHTLVSNRPNTALFTPTFTHRSAGSRPRRRGGPRRARRPWRCSRRRARSAGPGASTCPPPPASRGRWYYWFRE